MYKKYNSIDDLLHDVFNKLINSGQKIKPSQGEAKEITGVLLELKQPRARLSRSEGRGKIFSCLGEFLWCLTKECDLNIITYYIPRYTEYSDGSIAYGPRLFNWSWGNQIKNIQTRLRDDCDTRRGVVQLFDRCDLTKKAGDVPCTCVLQFLKRNNRLDLIVYMRSNDAYIGLPHDVFSFTMLQELIASFLEVDLGTYKHMVGSLHLYDKNLKSAQKFLDEGHQSTIATMPAMPAGDPWPNIELVMREEKLIRCQEKLEGDLDHLPDYWADIVRLLRIFRCIKGRKFEGIDNIKPTLSSDVYDAFVNDHVLRMDYENKI